MREDSDGRGPVYPWSHASEQDYIRFSVGDIVCSEPYDTRGTVSVVDVAAGTVGVIWSDGDGGAIVYPLDAPYLKKVEKMPWE